MQNSLHKTTSFSTDLRPTHLAHRWVYVQVDLCIQRGRKSQ